MIESLMLGISAAAIPVFVASPIALRRIDLRAAWVCFGVLLVTAICSVELQFILARARPPDPLSTFPLTGWPSFPSGHAMIAFALATFAALVCPRSRWWAFGGAVLVSVSRVVLGHHFASDVIVGACVGASMGAVGYGVFYSPPQLRRPRWAWWGFAQFALVTIAIAGATLGLTRFAFLKWPYADKVLHFVLYGALTFFAVGWFSRRSPRRVIAIMLVLATIDECAQALMPLRSFDPVDLICTVLGIIGFGAAAAKLVASDERRPIPGSG